MIERKYVDTVWELDGVLGTIVLRRENYRFQLRWTEFGDPRSYSTSGEIEANRDEVKNFLHVCGIRTDADELIDDVFYRMNELSNLGGSV